MKSSPRPRKLLETLTIIGLTPAIKDRTAFLQSDSMDAQYKKLLELAPYGPEDLSRWESAKQSLKDNPPSSTGQLIKTGTPQAWELDPIPVVLGSHDWAKFSNALG
ncbi:MAG: hypothetical protein ACK5GJ_01450 [Planctomycetota bacterium]